MNTNSFTKEQVIEFGKRLASANMVQQYRPYSHSRNVFSLFPQTEAQYRWLKKVCGTTRNVCILYTVAEVLSVVPELANCIVATKSNRFCRIELVLY
nr:MAG TPA: hypothetical protein [Caudoviricetes sp.]